MEGAQGSQWGLSSSSMVLDPGALHTLANANVSRVDLGPPAFRLRPTLTDTPPRNVHHGSAYRRVTRSATSLQYIEQPSGTRSSRTRSLHARSPSFFGRPSFGRLGTRSGLPGSAVAVVVARAFAAVMHPYKIAHAVVLMLHAPYTCLKDLLPP